MDFHSELTDRLYKVISELDTVEECRRFFEDLCTIKEIQDMGQRLETAILLDKGLSYKQIADTVGISSATISRVSRSLSYGSDGYRMVIDRLKEEKK